jgi:hypothetical protein
MVVDAHSRFVGTGKALPTAPNYHIFPYSPKNEKDGWSVLVLSDHYEDYEPIWLCHSLVAAIMRKSQEEGLQGMQASGYHRWDIACGGFHRIEFRRLDDGRNHLALVQEFIDTLEIPI